MACDEVEDGLPFRMCFTIVTIALPCYQDYIAHRRTIDTPDFAAAARLGFA
jgi:hypothetical protein